jgi:hypothetical protein
MGYRTSIESSALVFGNAFDLALNDMLEGSKDYHATFDKAWDTYKDTKIDYYKSDLNEALLTEEEKQLPVSQQNYISMRKKGHEMLVSYYKNILPRIKEVISVQGELNISGQDEDGNYTEDYITGKLDLIAMIEDDSGVVRQALLDNKSTSEPYPKNSVNKKDQLPLYACGYPEIDLFGYLTINKKTFKTQIILDTITEERKQEVLDKFIETLYNIKEEKFEQNSKGCYSFGKRCSFYTHCHNDYFSDDIYLKEKK